MRTGCEIAVVYGAGASHDSGYEIEVDQKHVFGNLASDVRRIKLPLDRGFFGHNLVKNAAGCFPSIKLFIETYFNSKLYEPTCSLGLEELWSAVDLNHKHIRMQTFDWDRINKMYSILSQSMEYLSVMDSVDTKDDPAAPGKTRPTKFKFLGDCGRHLKHLCFRIYGAPKLQHEHKSDSDHYWRLHDLLSGAELSHRLEYVTFNYDTCLEQSLSAGDVPLRYVTDYDAANVGFLLRDRVHVAKLHGSINWTVWKSEVKPVDIPSIQHGGRDDKGAFWGIEPTYPAGRNRDVEIREPLIIPPTWFKSEINDDGHTEDPVTRLVLHQWRVALGILSRAALIIVVGYSFPPTDFHVQRLFRLALMDRGKDNPVKLLYCIGSQQDEAKRAIQAASLLGFSENDVRIEAGGFSELCKKSCLTDHLEQLL